MTTRPPPLFTPDDDDLDLSGFTTKQAQPTQAPISADAVKTVAAENGFPSRSPSVVYVRYKTGRTVLLGARITQRAHDEFHQIVEAERLKYERGEIEQRVTLGQVVERALAALKREMAAEGKNVA